MRDFHMRYHEAIKFPLIQAHALCAFARLNNPWVEMEIVGAGYIQQSVNARTSQRDVPTI